MSRCFNHFININNNAIPIIFIDGEFSRFNIPSLDDSRNDLLVQVELISKMLKREDYNQIVLSKVKIEDAKQIIDITKWFLEEDIIVSGIWTDKIKADALEKLGETINYIIVRDEVKTFEKGRLLSYKRNL